MIWFMFRPLPRHLTALVALVAALALIGAACADDDNGDDNGDDATTTTEAASGVDALRINELQMIGSHNSYKERPREEISAALETLAPELLAEIDYGHLSLTEQLDEYGVRQLELDVMADPEGGRYSTPAALEILGIDESEDPVMDEPGFKVQHTQDVDYASNCLTLVVCLEEVEQWSSANPDHLPVMVMVETKTLSIEDGAEGLGVDLSGFDVEFADPPDMTPELFDELETEITSVFTEDRVITPDDVRGDRDTLEEAVLSDGWPTVGESRGKVLFSLIDTGDSKDTYLEGAPSLEGRIMFTSGTPGDPDAAFVRVDDSLEDGGELDDWSAAGYLIRTRTDVPGVHAPTNDTSLRDSAFESGAHYLSTDYYFVEEELGTGYLVQFDGGVVARCNPVSASPDCDDDLLADER